MRLSSKEAATRLRAWQPLVKFTYFRDSHADLCYVSSLRHRSKWAFSGMRCMCHTQTGDSVGSPSIADVHVVHGDIAGAVMPLLG